MKLLYFDVLVIYAYVAKHKTFQIRIRLYENFQNFCSVELIIHDCWRPDLPSFAEPGCVLERTHASSPSCCTRARVCTWRPPYVSQCVGGVRRYFRPRNRKKAKKRRKKEKRANEKAARNRNFVTRTGLGTFTVVFNYGGAIACWLWPPCCSNFSSTCWFKETAITYVGILGGKTAFIVPSIWTMVHFVSLRWHVEQVLIINKRNNRRYKNTEINSTVFRTFSRYIIFSLFFFFLQNLILLSLLPSDVDLTNFWKVQHPKVFPNLRKFVQKNINV